jgi:hypothetical protein
VRRVQGVQRRAQAHELHRVLHHHAVVAAFGRPAVELRPAPCERGPDVVARVDQVAVAERVVARVPQLLGLPRRARPWARAAEGRLDDAVLVAVAALAAAEREGAVDTADPGDDNVGELVCERVAVVQAAS